MIRSLNTHGIARRSVKISVTHLWRLDSTWQIRSSATLVGFPSKLLKIAPCADIVALVSIPDNPFDRPDTGFSPSGLI